MCPLEIKCLHCGKTGEFTMVIESWSRGEVRLAGYSCPSCNELISQVDWFRAMTLAAETSEEEDSSEDEEPETLWECKS